MNTTIAKQIAPSFFHYGTIAERVLVLQHLMQSATKYRANGRWGEYGPSNNLNGYHGCTNSCDTVWHSSRNGLVSWQDHFNNLGEMLLASQCESCNIDKKWRSKSGVGLHTAIKLRVRKNAYTSIAEQKSWVAFQKLHATVVDAPNSFNSCHKKVNVLCYPQLTISANHIRLRVSVTDAYELRHEKTLGLSSWDFDFLLGEGNTNQPWSPFRETFVQFIDRTVKFYKTRKGIHPE